jgi:hypothetical protein
MLKGRPAREETGASDLHAVIYLERTPEHVFAHWRNLVVAYWIGRTNSSAVLRLNTALTRLGEEFKEGIGLIQVVHEKAPAPESTSRSALQAMLRDQSDIIACSSVVSPGVGFRAASVRALITGLVMLARPKFPHLIHATVEETAKWHAEHLPGGSVPPNPRAILRAIRDIIALDGSATDPHALPGAPAYRKQIL